MRMRNRMRNSAATKNSPTPSATERMSAALGTPGTCSASTCKSGSETVTITPTKNETSSTTHSFLLRVMAAPTCSPMGVMAKSVPRVNMPMPTTSRAAPTKKASIASVGAGASVTHSASTMAVIGSTDASDSFHFSYIMLRCCPRRFLSCARFFCTFSFLPPAMSASFMYSFPVQCRSSSARPPGRQQA